MIPLFAILLFTAQQNQPDPFDTPEMKAYAMRDAEKLYDEFIANPDEPKIWPRVANDALSVGACRAFYQSISPDAFREVLRVRAKLSSAAMVDFEDRCAIWRDGWDTANMPH